jgi:eukaryotic-like serine/threonine-protein kinase
MAPLSSDRWRAVSPYLDEALDIASEDRGAWLESIRAHDSALAADLEVLLGAQEAVHESRFLEHAVPLPSRAGLTLSLAGQTLGAYRLVSRIGQGGMGSVWLAERSDGRFEGRAAVKLLNLALMGRAGEERFRREGTILARLTHPHIARLTDAGLSPTGQPYLVLEHVDGQSIDEYCQEQALSIEARLRLFLDVLEAVAHAHANLIVHRDIKPANVLVSVDGQVKLLDFGIAKLMESDGEWGRPRVGELSALTREGGTALTPEYAAPEQLSGGQVTTATDVYALGVLLYVLLSGQHPAGPDVRSPATLVRAIVEIEPRRLSEVVAPTKLRRTLRGDLDTIVAKALKKNASERYPSVTALADDIRRSLRHEPISARPDSLGYRTATFVRRHVRGVAMSATVVLLLGGSTVFYTSRLAAARDHAQREAEKAAKVSEALIGLLTGADPIANRATGEGPTVRALLDAGADRVHRELAGQPEFQAEIFTILGRLYRRFGVYDKAQQLLEEALASGRIVYGEENVRVAQTLNDLGALLSERGDYSTAERYLERSLAVRRRLLGTEHADVAVTLVELGRVYQDLGFNDRSEPMQREALAIRRKVLGDEHRETAVSLSGLASVLRLKGDLSGAEVILRQSLEMNRRTRGPDHANTGSALHDLALVATARRDYVAAESMFQQSLEITRKALGDKHPTVAMALNGLSRVYRDQKRYGEAAVALQDALDIARPTLGSDHQLVAIYTLNLGAVQLARNEPAAAEALLREGLRIRRLAPALVPARRRAFPEDDWTVAAIESLLAKAASH